MRFNNQLLYKIYMTFLMIALMNLGITLSARAQGGAGADHSAFNDYDPHDPRTDVHLSGGDEGLTLHSDGDSNDGPADDEPLNVRMYLQVDISRLVEKEETDIGSLEREYIQFGSRGSGSSHFWIEADWEQQVRTVAKINLSHLFTYHDGNEIRFADGESFEVGQFVDHAFIEFREVGGAPVAVLVGKKDLFLGVRSIETIMSMSSNYWGTKGHNGVFALTVKFDTNEISPFDQLVDRVELTLYEAEGEDFDINGEEAAGFIAQVEKDLSDRTTFVIGYSQHSNEYLRSEMNDFDNFDYGPQSTGVIGLQHRFNKDVRGWAEALAVQRYPTIMSSLRNGDDDYYFGGSVGGAVDFFDDAFTVAGHVNVLAGLSQEFGLGVRVPLFSKKDPLWQRLELGFQVAHIRYEDDVTHTFEGAPSGEPFGYIGRDSETNFGVHLRYKLYKD